VARHARANRVDITWRRVGDEFQLVIDDDGVGFDPSLPSPPGHHGRRHLEERARLAGGRLEVQSRPHEGSRVALTGPMPQS
jgi:signal transduction histidine kinase